MWNLNHDSFVDYSYLMCDFLPIVDFYFQPGVETFGLREFCITSLLKNGKVQPWQKVCDIAAEAIVNSIWQTRKSFIPMVRT